VIKAHFLFIVPKGCSIMAEHEDTQSAKKNENDPEKAVNKVIEKKEDF